jgi:hypothetical protein
MGDATRKRKQLQALLLTHPWCVYCGAPATTIDHCPPRCFFEGRQWPESYAFPACADCNEQARLDEQALGVLIRIKLSANPQKRNAEWEKLMRGVRNNQPRVLAEWTEHGGIISQKHGMRERFGVEGDRLRREGWGLWNIGPLTQSVMIRFMIKLSKALYYRHNGVLFDGVIYASHIDSLSKDSTPAFFADILRMAPTLLAPKRNNRSLADQFIYRFNHNAEHGVMYAVVQFSEQFIFQLIALRSDMDEKLAVMAREAKAELPAVGIGRYVCPLTHTPAVKVA